MATPRPAVPKRKPPASLPKSAVGSDITIIRQLKPDTSAAPPDSATMVRIDKEQREKARLRQLQRRRDVI